MCVCECVLCIWARNFISYFCWHFGGDFALFFFAVPCVVQLFCRQHVLAQDLPPEFAGETTLSCAAASPAQARALDPLKDIRKPYKYKLIKIMPACPLPVCVCVNASPAASSGYCPAYAAGLLFSFIFYFISFYSILCSPFFVVCSCCCCCLGLVL